MKTLCELPLRGAGGEPISFPRTIYSHGCAALPPAIIQESPLVYRRRLRIANRVVEIELRERDGMLVAETASRLNARGSACVQAAIAKMFRLHDDLSPFYALIAADDALGWAAAGAGRILASPTVFEDVVKTICTTNCAWSATVRMTTALAALGGGAFPEPDRLAETPERWYRDVARMGYRGSYVSAIARAVAIGDLDLEALLEPRQHDDATVEALLLALPGIGPYGAAHVMQLLGRHRPLVLDSWTRPKYRRLAGRKQAKDSTIRRAFARYGAYAGLAFWLFLTRDWLE
ncbi:MAG: Fe-S cluster assembly protein HesB [Candidatus Eremiobacteraeota bacterium]|nr:Fe-S cluster assembly protein HesB [Candidatus Eremiobacteraeota bacterium]